MTNWMTATGIALIAGGLATLICFRALLFGAGRRRARRTRALVVRDEAAVQPESRRARNSRRRTRATEPLATAGDEPAPAGDEAEQDRDDVVSALRAVEAGESYEHDYLAGPGPDVEMPGPDVDAETPPRLAPDAGHDGDRIEGDRIEGWVRPEYRHVREVPRAGEYWMPIAVDLDPDPEPSAKGYGWPAPVERLPAVPSYEPSGGLGPDPLEHEPTEVVTLAAIDGGGTRARPQRSWSVRNEKREYRRETRRGRRFVEELPPAREWRPEHELLPGSRRAQVTELTQLFARVADDPRPPTGRRRPRPRPRPAEPPPDRSTTVYVSRHAAEPPPR